MYQGEIFMYRRRRRHIRRRRRNTGGVRRQPRHQSSGRKRIFSMAAWMASFIMMLNMLPADSPVSQALERYEESLPAMSFGLEELKNGPDVTDENNADEKTDVAEDTGIDIIVSDERKITVSDAPDESDTEENTEPSNAVLTDNTSSSEKTINVSSASGSGDIIIYHTHATEAYMPVAATATHTTDVAGTVREAGNNLSAALTAKGYNVIHDGTMHDSPSYNNSYNRSLETLKSLLGKYPSPKLVIDFHRDAASTGKAKTANVNGETVASFALVVGTKNDNYTKIRAFAEKIVAKANEMYPGLSTGIIEKPYKFNGYLSNNYILLELGNNANTIDQINAAVPYLADVFTNVLG
jgi:stage II sporulation protein P